MMRLAIFESIITPGGHEADFDRILVEELQALGHEVCFCVPQNLAFKLDYGVPVHYLPGEGVSYTGLRGLSKAVAAFKREINRQRWYKALLERAKAGEFDAIIVPTSTYRYLRALNMNALKKSPVPVIFVAHGINPQEAPAYFREVERLSPYPNIKMAVLTFGEDVLGRSYPNMVCLQPPVYSPRDIKPRRVIAKPDVLRLGFFGQYRKEKNLEAFLETFLACKFTRQVELFVQGATVSPADTEDFDRIIGKYSGVKELAFLHKGLAGREWQEAINGIDALIMPYSATRYLYHWSAMLFTAIGYYKPAVLSAEINPEVLQRFAIGQVFENGVEGSLKHAIENFVNSFDDKLSLYQNQLEQANAEYSPRFFAEKLAAIAAGK